MARPKPNTQRADFAKRVPLWKKVRDFIEGEDAVKLGRERYLPRPNKSDTSQHELDRYECYLDRAVFYNATGRTHAALVGLAFNSAPSIILPPEIQAMVQNADGAGTLMINQAQNVLAELLITGRGGLLADFPSVNSGTVSRAQAEALGVHPRIVFYPAEGVRDWAVESVGSAVAGGGGRSVLTMVQLNEKFERRDGFEIIEGERIRVLRLAPESIATESEFSGYDLSEHTLDTLVVVYDIYEELGGAGARDSSSIVLDASGKPLREIPFYFLGSTSNDPGFDPLPMYDLVSLNAGHYRNSADYEESVFLCGQPTPYMTGIDEHWYQMLMEKGLYLGSRAVLGGPVGSTIGLLQAAPNTLAKEAMGDKERLMASIGARLVQSGAAKTAEQTRSENRNSNSVLSLTCDNLSAGYTRALRMAARFQVANPALDEISFYLSTDFDGFRVDPDVLTALVDAVQRGHLPLTDFWDSLRRLNLIDSDKTDDDVRAELESMPQGSMAELTVLMNNGVVSPETLFEEAKRRGMIPKNSKWETEQQRLTESMGPEPRDGIDQDGQPGPSGGRGPTDNVGDDE